MHMHPEMNFAPLLKHLVYKNIFGDGGLFGVIFREDLVGRGLISLHDYTYKSFDCSGPLGALCHA